MSAAGRCGAELWIVPVVDRVAVGAWRMYGKLLERLKCFVFDLQDDREPMPQPLFMLLRGSHLGSCTSTAAVARSAVCCGVSGSS